MSSKNFIHQMNRYRYLHRAVTDGLAIDGAIDGNGPVIDTGIERGPGDGDGYGRKQTACLAIIGG